MEITHLLSPENMEAMRKQEYTKGRKDGYAIGWEQAMRYMAQMAQAFAPLTWERPWIDSPWKAESP